MALNGTAWRGTRAVKSWRVLAIIVAAGATIALVASCASAQGRAARLSGAVAFAEENAQTLRFLANPGIGYVEASMRFGSDFPDDVIVFVDQEMLEGLTKYRWVRGGDWMAFVGVQRAGAVWVAGGTERTAKGEPSKDRNWSIHDLKQRLEPDVWYRMRVVADFEKRRFVSFSIQGGKLNRTFDLSKVRLDYPNYMPFDRAGMIYIVGAMRGRSMMKREGTPLVYFDDVEGGVIHADGRSERLFFDDFETQKTVGHQPVTPHTIALGNYTLGKWYLERDESIFRIEPAPFARSGKHVGVADAHLKD